jgi:glycosyltransferase involved in cell wall biosynthesis
MKFIIYSAVSAKNISSYLGKPEYSYYFVLKKYLPVFESLGSYVVVHSFDTIEYQIEKCINNEIIVICCAPPNKSYINVDVRVVNVFAWEFDNLPNEIWDCDPMQNWEYVLSQHSGAITLSTDSQQAVLRSLGENYPVEVIPVPIWDDFQSLYIDHANAVQDKVILEVDGSVIASKNYIRSDSIFDVAAKDVQIQRKNCPASLVLNFDIDSEASGYIGGFYEAEEWGVWSKHAAPWVLMPYALVGEFVLSIRVNAYENNIGRTLYIEIGDYKHSFTPNGEFEIYSFTFNLAEPVLIIRFSDINVKAVDGAIDERSMGIGLESISITRLGDVIDLPDDANNKSQLILSGVVYTTVFNPDDDRKNWQSIVKGFCFAFKDKDDATLVLKITHHSLGRFLGKFHYLLASLGDFSCNVIVIHGYLDKCEFEKLIQATTYYVNASKCEGLCMPLMEYMAAGKPAVATCNTAMMDYFNESLGFVVNSSEAPSIWPHDPRQLYKTIQYRIDWMSLVNEFNNSYGVAKNDIDKYHSMASASTNAIKAFSSSDNVTAIMAKFISSLTLEVAER